jgi:hypothetical protein
MNSSCPVCGLQFEVEPGYFLGAMYFSYLLGIPLLVGFTAIVWLLFPRWPFPYIFLCALLFFMPFAPLLFRYSRVLWLHLDRALDPPPEG